MAIIKRGKKDNQKDLINALAEFAELLESQNEDEAIADLLKAKEIIMTSTPESDSFKKAISSIIDAFEGDHELMAYTHARKGGGGEWTIADQLCTTSSRVFNLAQRFKA
jgi:hypothetical protein